MGLDMYFSRRVSISNYDFDPNGKVLANSILAALNAQNPEQYSDGSVTIMLPAGYWRKVNAIHAWFVANVQGGEDNCEETYVPKEQMIELHSLCKRVLADHSLAEELLPAQSGFFFGDTSYDEWYFQGLEHTLDILDRALDQDNNIGAYDSFYYQSSW